MRNALIVIRKSNRGEAERNEANNGSRLPIKTHYYNPKNLAILYPYPKQ